MSSLILLVEDNPSDEKLTLRAFAKSEVPNEIVVAHDGAEALDYLFAQWKYSDHARPPLPDLIVLDLKLPRIDGLEVIRRLRAEDSTRVIPIVVLTASREEEDVARGFSLGANAYVRKPVAFTQFLSAVNAISIFWLTVNEHVPRRTGIP